MTGSLKTNHPLKLIISNFFGLPVIFKEEKSGREYKDPCCAEKQDKLWNVTFEKSEF